MESKREPNGSGNNDNDSSDIVIATDKLDQEEVRKMPRESLLRYFMNKMQNEYINLEEITVYVATWNVNGQAPGNFSLKNWLACENKPPDIYAIGFQELDLSKEAYLFSDTKRGEEWREAALNSLHPDARYKPIGVVRLVGMLLIVMCKYELYSHVHNISVDTVGTGLMNKIGNKGGVGVRFDIHNTSMCFVNSHLAAHTEEVERRNQDYHDICARMSFTRPQPCMIKDHDQIFWLGDLNYRVADLTMQEVKERLIRGEMQSILMADQLAQEHTKCKVLSGFKEGDITFAPTYKYDPGTDHFDTSEKARAPAWCDRVFWRGEHIQQEAYRSHPDMRLSDHKPVSAVFKSQIKVIDLQRYRKVHEVMLKKMDKLENEYLPQVAVDRTEVQFNTVRMFEKNVQYLIIANTGQVPVQFRFINKLDDANYCKEWLEVTPCWGEINPGETCDIRFEIVLKSYVTKLYDILVLHLEGGKDMFITIVGECERSCFITPLSELCRLPVPISHMTKDHEVQMKTGPVLYNIPREIFLMVDFLYRHGLRDGALFERYASKEDLIEVKNWLDVDGPPPAPQNSRIVSEALLIFLMSNPEPVVPHKLHSNCVAASPNFAHSRQIVQKLPAIEKNVFLYICLFLQELLQHSNENNLNARTLATIFGDALLPELRPKPQVNRLKAEFVRHFLVNDISDIISQVK